MKLDKFEEAEEKYNQAIQTYEANFGANKGKLDLYFISGKDDQTELDELINNLISLQPTNPAIVSAVVEIFSKHKIIEDVIPVLENKLLEYHEDQEVIGNLNYHLGIVHAELYKDTDAKDYFNIARESFKKVLSEDHHVFQAIDEYIKLIDGVEND